MGIRPLLGSHDLSALRIILCGGAAPRSLSEAYREAKGVPLLQAWGMTETSRLCTTSSSRTHHDAWTDDERADARARQGQPAPLVDLRITDPDTGAELPWDDNATGELQAAGAWIAAENYHGEGGGTQFTNDGWLRTGDVAAVEEAAVIGIPHEKWTDRPLACLVVKQDHKLTADDLIDFLTHGSSNGGSRTPSSSSMSYPKPASASSPRRPCATDSPARHTKRGV